MNHADTRQTGTLTDEQKNITVNIKTDWIHGTNTGQQKIFAARNQQKIIKYKK